MINFDEEFLKAFAEIAGYQLPRDAVEELKAYHPEIYAGLSTSDWKKGDVIHKACRQYLSIIRGYMVFYRMPFTIESLTVAYDWGVGNLKDRGIEKAPARIKEIIAKINHQLQPQHDQIEAEYMNKG